MSIKIAGTCPVCGNNLVVDIVPATGLWEVRHEKPHDCEIEYVMLYETEEMAMDAAQKRADTAEPPFPWYTVFAHVCANNKCSECPFESAKICDASPKPVSEWSADRKRIVALWAKHSEQVYEKRVANDGE